MLSSEDYPEAGPSSLPPLEHGHDDGSGMAQHQGHDQLFFLRTRSSSGRSLFPQSPADQGDPPAARQSSSDSAGHVLTACGFFLNTVPLPLTAADAAGMLPTGSFLAQTGASGHRPCRSSDHSHPWVSAAPPTTPVAVVYASAVHDATTTAAPHASCLTLGMSSFGVRCGRTSAAALSADSSSSSSSSSSRSSQRSHGQQPFEDDMDDDHFSGTVVKIGCRCEQGSLEELWMFDHESDMLQFLHQANASAAPGEAVTASVVSSSNLRVHGTAADPHSQLMVRFVRQILPRLAAASSAAPSYSSSSSSSLLFSSSVAGRIRAALKPSSLSRLSLLAFSIGQGPSQAGSAGSDAGPANPLEVTAESFASSTNGGCDLFAALIPKEFLAKYLPHSMKKFVLERAAVDASLVYHQFCSRTGASDRMGAGAAAVAAELIDSSNLMKRSAQALSSAWSWVSDNLRALSLGERGHTSAGPRSGAATMAAGSANTAAAAAAAAAASGSASRPDQRRHPWFTSTEEVYAMDLVDQWKLNPSFDVTCRLSILAAIPPLFSSAAAAAAAALASQSPVFPSEITTGTTSTTLGSWALPAGLIPVPHSVTLTRTCLQHPSATSDFSPCSRVSVLFGNVGSLPMGSASLSPSPSASSAGDLVGGVTVAIPVVVSLLVRTLEACSGRFSLQLLSAVLGRTPAPPSFSDLRFWMQEHFLDGSIDWHRLARTLCSTLLSLVFGGRARTTLVYELVPAAAFLHGCFGYPPLVEAGAVRVYLRWLMASAPSASPTLPSFDGSLGEQGPGERADAPTWSMFPPSSRQGRQNLMDSLRGRGLLRLGASSNAEHSEFPHGTAAAATGREGDGDDDSVLEGHLLHWIRQGTDRQEPASSVAAADHPADRAEYHAVAGRRQRKRLGLPSSADHLPASGNGPRGFFEDGLV